MSQPFTHSKGHILDWCELVGPAPYRLLHRTCSIRRTIQQLDEAESCVSQRSSRDGASLKVQETTHA